MRKWAVSYVSFPAQQHIMRGVRWLSCDKRSYMVKVKVKENSVHCTCNCRCPVLLTWLGVSTGAPLCTRYLTMVSDCSVSFKCRQVYPCCNFENEKHLVAHTMYMYMVYSICTCTYMYMVYSTCGVIFTEPMTTLCPVECSTCK